MNDAESNPPPKSFLWISSLALIWNLIGLASYVARVTMSPDALAALPEAQRGLYENVPAWATSAYAIATTAGVVGSLLLLLKRAWAVPVFIISLLAVLAQMYHAFGMTNAYEVLGPSSVYLPAAIVVIAVALIGYAGSAKRKGWIT